jgi:hypothetical protein
LPDEFPRRSVITGNIAHKAKSMEPATSVLCIFRRSNPRQAM